MKAYLDLTDLKKRVPRSHEVKEKYVREYNSILEFLSRASGYNLDSFCVPESELHQKELWFTLSSEEGGEGYTHPESEIHQKDNESYTHYSPDLYCLRAILMKKMGTILNFFKVTSSGGTLYVDFKLPNI
jgi:hypothetical protein